MPQIVPDSGGTGNPAIDPNVRAKAMKTGYWSYRYDAKFNRVFQIPEDTSGEAASTDPFEAVIFLSYHAPIW
jgi:hypothetical protein